MKIVLIFLFQQYKMDLMINLTFKCIDYLPFHDFSFHIRILIIRLTL